jgi:hypothetical protein
MSEQPTAKPKIGMGKQPIPRKPLPRGAAPPTPPAAKDFDPKKYLTPYIEAQQKRLAEANAALEKQIEVDKEKFTPYVGRQFRKKDHGLPRYVFKIQSFVPRMHMGTLGNRAAFFVVRLPPYEGSHFHDCEEFLRDYIPA